MATVKFDATYRDDLTKSHMKKIRRDGYATGSIFGHGEEPVNVEIKLDELVKLLKGTDSGLTSLIDLKIDKGPKGASGPVIIKEFFKDPLTKRVLDIQFQRINMKEELNVSIPIEFVGDAPGTKEGGLVDHGLIELDIRCLPGDIPPKVVVDISGLNIGDSISVSDLDLPDNISINTPEDAVVCSVYVPHIAEPDTELEEVEGEEGEEMAEGEEGAEGEEAAEESE